MTNETELLLTEEYNAFNLVVSQAYEDKSKLEAEFKSKFEEYKSSKAELEKRVEDAQMQWEEWKNRQLGIQSGEEATTVSDS